VSSHLVFGCLWEVPRSLGPSLRIRWHFTPLYKRPDKSPLWRLSRLIGGSELPRANRCRNRPAALARVVHSRSGRTGAAEPQALTVVRRQFLDVLVISATGADADSRKRGSLVEADQKNQTLTQKFCLSGHGRWRLEHRILRYVDNKLCAHWDLIVAEADKPRPPLASRWSPCLERQPIDQEALARTCGLLESLDRPPYPPTMPSLSFAIY